MMVIAAIGQESIPRGVQDVTKEQYALALEQMLIHHYKLFKKDVRIANDTFTAGRTDGNSSTAYALYMAYAIEGSSIPASSTSAATKKIPVKKTVTKVKK